MIDTVAQANEEDRLELFGPLIVDNIGRRALVWLLYREFRND